MCIQFSATCTTFVASLINLFGRALSKELEVVAGTVAGATGAYHMTRQVRIDCLGSQFVQPTFLHVRTGICQAGISDNAKLASGS